MKNRRCILLYTCLLTLLANSYLLLTVFPWLLLIGLPLYLLMHLFAGTKLFAPCSRRLRICSHGAVLLFVFQLSGLLSLIFHAALAPLLLPIPGGGWKLLWSVLLCVLLEAGVFWNGILCVYFTSAQLGIRHRVTGILCGMIPVVNLIVLNRILKTVFRELQVESQKEQQNAARKPDQICRTKYPVLLVHGVFFRDSRYLNYWGRIPGELERNGATVYYGEQPSAASVSDCAAFLAERIKRITEQTGCEKVNIIAHSKGGLDCRCAIADMGAAPYVASLTTINTPHRGCIFADYLLEKAPQNFKEQVAAAYDNTLQKLGETEADFLAAVTDLTASACLLRDQQMPQPAEIFCQSVGSRLDHASGGSFPLNLSYHLVKYFDGPNDGLVSEDSFQWGDRFAMLTPIHKRGISHGDMIDLNRENLEDFDVREFYVQLVADLKNKGL